VVAVGVWFWSCLWDEAGTGVVSFFFFMKSGIMLLKGLYLQTMEIRIDD
jgi:hypothetical protein